MAPFDKPTVRKAGPERGSSRHEHTTTQVGFALPADRQHPEALNRTLGQPELAGPVQRTRSLPHAYQHGRTRPQVANNRHSDNARASHNARRRIADRARECWSLAHPECATRRPSSAPDIAQIEGAVRVLQAPVSDDFPASGNAHPVTRRSSDRGASHKRGSRTPRRAQARRPRTRVRYRSLGRVGAYSTPVSGAFGDVLASPDKLIARERAAENQPRGRSAVRGRGRPPR